MDFGKVLSEEFKIVVEKTAAILSVCGNKRIEK